jgi:hypothetical protein
MFCCVFDDFVEFCCVLMCFDVFFVFCVVLLGFDDFSTKNTFSITNTHF